MLHDAGRSFDYFKVIALRVYLYEQTRVGVRYQFTQDAVKPPYVNDLFSLKMPINIFTSN